MPLLTKQRNWYRPTPGLTAKNRDQLRNPTLGNRVWATFTSLCNRWGLGSPQENGNFLEGASPGPFKLGDIWRELKLLARWRRRGAPDFRSCIATASNLPAVILTIIWYSITHSLFFILGLKPFFSANLSHRCTSFSSSSGFTTWIPKTV